MTFLQYIPETAADIRYSIMSVAERHSMRLDVSLALLIHYGFDDILLDQDMFSKERTDVALAGMTRSTLLGRDQYLTCISMQRCQNCQQRKYTVRTDCGHYICPNCVGFAVLRSVQHQHNLLPLCPHCDHFYINPTIICQILPLHISNLYFNALQAAWIRKRAHLLRQNSLTPFGFSMLGSVTIFTGLTGYGWMKYRAFKQSNPRLTRLLSDMKDLYDEGESLKEPSFWVKLSKKEMSRQLDTWWTKIKSWF